MFRKIRTVVLCVAGLTFLGWNPARAATYPLVSFANLQGIIVRSIHQDSRGFVWLATDCGLWRWNRDGFEPARTCITGEARCLVEDDHATLWVGTPDGLVGVDIDSLESRVDRRILSGTCIRRLYRDPRGRIWCGTLRGLYRLDCTGEGCTATLVEGTEGYQVGSIAAGPTGDLWVGTWGALLHVLDGSVDRLFESIIGASIVDALLQASDGSLWMGLRNDGGLYRIVDGRPVRLTQQDGLPSDDVNAIAEAQSGDIWVSTEHGVHRFTDGGFTPVSRRTGLENEDVHALIFDREKQIWIGTYGSGVYLLRTPHVLTYGLDDGVPHPVVTALARDSTGELVVGTIEGAAYFAPDGASSKPRSSARHVRAAFLDDAGVLWIGGPAGVWRLDDLTISASVREIFSMGEDADGRLLVGTASGLWKFEGPRAERLTLPMGSASAVRAILRSRDGGVYVGTAQGLVRGRGGQWDLAADNLEVNALCEDPAGRLWVGTSTGLLAFDTSSLATPAAQWTSTGEVRALACDPSGTVWAGTDDGIVRLRDSELERFTLCDGLPSRDVRALLLDEDGHLYAGTTQGLARIDTQRLTPCATRPRIALEAFIAGGRSLSTGKVPLSIRYADRNVSVHIRSLGWRSAAGVRYQFKLEGHDEAWSAPTRQTTRQYTQLAPEPYTLLARCVNARGLESENVVRIGFAILPPIWRTAWFAVLMSVVLVSTLLLGAGLFVKRAKLLGQRRSVQDALRASEARYRTLVETIPHGVQEIDASGTILFSSTPHHAMLNFQEGELAGKPMFELLARAEERDSLRDYFALLVRDQPSPAPYVTQNRTKDGRAIDVQVDWNYKRNAAGEVIGFISVITDITERTRIEKALRESESKFRTLAETVAAATFIFQEERLLYVNPTAVAITGYSREELLERPFWEVIHPEFRPLVRQRGLARQDGEQIPQRYEVKILCKTGEERWVDFTAGMIEYDGRPAVLGTAFDVTQRKQAEAALRTSEEQFRQIAETIRQVFWVGSPDWREVHYVSPAYEELWGRSRQNLYDEPLSWLDAVHPDDRERVLAEIEKRTSGEFSDTESSEYRVVRPDGAVRWILARAYPVYDESGQVIRIAGIAEDITEQKRTGESLRLQARILENMSEGVNLVRVRDGRIVYANPTFERMFGYNPGELDGEHISIVNAAGAKSPREAANDIALVLEKDGIWSGEIQNVRKDGRWFWCYVNVSTFEHPEYGQVWLGVQQDITERKRAEAAFREAEAQQALILRSLPLALYTADVSGEFGATWVSHQIERISGFPPRRWVGDAKFWGLGLHPDDRERALSEYAALLVKDEIATEYRWRCADGTYRWFLDHAVLVRDESGKPKEAIGTWLDITERKRAEEALRESEEKYRGLFEQANDSILLVDKVTTKFREFNDKAHKNLGYTRAEFQDLTISDIEAVESTTEVADHIQDILTEGGDEFETQHRTKDGEIRDVLVNAKVISIAGREFLQSIWRDITGRKRAEEQAQRDQAALAHAARLATMGEMATGLAHELGQPLAAIANYLHTSLGRIRAGVLDGNELRIDLERAGAQAKRAGDIVHGIHEFVRKSESRQGREAVSALVRKAVDLMRVELRDGGIQLRLEFTEALPPVTADAIQIQQVIINLMRNSLEAMRESDAGTRQLTILSTRSSHAWVEIAVRDTGPGLPDEGRKRVFDPFFTTKPEGMGMGLSICRSIIESHGGRLWITSPQGDEGITFRFTLPVDRQES